MVSRFARTILGALAAGAMLLFGGAANAYFVGTSFDPTFFDGLGTFFVPDSPSACASLSDGFHSVNVGGDPCTGVLLISAAVNVADGGGTAHLSLPPPVPSVTSITGLVIDLKALSIVVGVNTILIPILADACTGDLCGYQWYIQWDSGLPGGEELDNQVFLYRQICEGEFCGDIVQFGDPATHVTFFPTPEPGSLALLVGALGAAWLARRRLRQRPRL